MFMEKLVFIASNTFKISFIQLYIEIYGKEIMSEYKYITNWNGVIVKKKTEKNPHSLCSFLVFGSLIYICIKFRSFIVTALKT